MPEATKSKKLLTLFRDRLRDQGKVKERSDGLIYDLFTEGQMYFMETLGITKVPYPIILFEGQDEYPLPRNILEINDWHFSREELNPLFEMPRTGASTVRSLKITNPPVRTPLGWTDASVADPDNMIREGDIITLDVVWKPNEDDKIDDEHDPILDPGFHRHLVHYALSFYRDFTYMVDGKEVREQNPKFRSTDEVYQEVIRKRDLMYNLNSIQLIDMGGPKF